MNLCTRAQGARRVYRRWEERPGVTGFSVFADLLVDMLGVLARYSITVKELKLFFSKLQGEKGCWVFAVRSAICLSVSVPFILFSFLNTMV